MATQAICACVDPSHSLAAQHELPRDQRSPRVHAMLPFRSRAAKQRQRPQCRILCCTQVQNMQLLAHLNSMQAVLWHPPKHSASVSPLCSAPGQNLLALRALAATRASQYENDLRVERQAGGSGSGSGSGSGRSRGFLRSYHKCYMRCRSCRIGLFGIAAAHGVNKVGQDACRSSLTSD
jgi:hypothetical protein